MDKLAMLSILVATIVAPAAFARDPVARRGLARTVVFLFAFIALYVAYVTLVHTTWYVPPDW